MSGDVEMTFPHHGRQNLEMSFPKDTVEKKGPRKITVRLVVLSLILGGAMASVAYFYQTKDIVESAVMLDDAPENTISDDEANWVSALVTLEDGPKYEIVKQLEHDPNSFMYVHSHLIGIIIIAMFFSLSLTVYVSSQRRARLFQWLVV